MNKKLFFALVGLIAFSFATRADIIPTLDSVIGLAGARPMFNWNYSANVTVNQTVNAGDFFTIYDFSSMMPTAGSQPTGWTFSTALLGPTAPLTSPTDNPNFWNVTWTYNGATPIAGSAALGIFSVVTNTDQLKVGQLLRKPPEAVAQIPGLRSATLVTCRCRYPSLRRCSQS